MFAFTEMNIRPFLFGGGLILFLILELIIPYRENSVSKLKRWLNNLSLTLVNSLILNLLFASIIIATAEHAQANHIGILNMFHAPGWLKILITISCMDFALYIWHLLNHNVPFLWRFHRVHHSDLNMDVSSATRFHIGELSISALIKISLIYLLGASPTGVLIFESALVLSAQFHHSSIKVPVWFEKLYWFFFVPPSMHRIHHSVVIKERDSNYATIFSLWDRFMGTLTQDTDQNTIKIGVGAYRQPEKLNLHHLLLMPFTKQIK